LDCHKRLRACGHREKRTQARTTNQINRLLNNKFGSNLRPQIAGNTKYIIFCPQLGHSEELSLKKSELSSLPKS
jgi:hypothetical protein